LPTRRSGITQSSRRRCAPGAWKRCRKTSPTNARKGKSKLKRLLSRDDR
jgi:hypothetical protein